MRALKYELHVNILVICIICSVYLFLGESKDRREGGSRRGGGGGRGKSRGGRGKEEVRGGGGRGQGKGGLHRKAVDVCHPRAGRGYNSERGKTKSTYWSKTP